MVSVGGCFKSRESSSASFQSSIACCLADSLRRCFLRNRIRILRCSTENRSSNTKTAGKVMNENGRTVFTAVLPGSEVVGSTGASREADSGKAGAGDGGVASKICQLLLCIL